MTIGLQTKRWSRAEYERLVACGIFRPGERLELLSGALVVAEPQSSRHATAIDLAADALRVAFGAGWRVRVQMPVALDEESEPEPDLSVVPGPPRSYRDAHPSRVALVVEVAESSLDLDRRDKAGLYARAGLPEYWIVNLPARVVEVHRSPAPDAGAPYGWRYGSVAALGAGDAVSPLAVPGASIAVADLLP
jgi:Uma2 family endonuclease